MNRFAVVLLVTLGIAADVRAQGVAGAVRDLLDSDDWASLRVAGEHVHGRASTGVVAIGAVAMGVTIWPAFALVNTGNPALFMLALVLVFGLAMSPAGGATGSLFSMVFSREVRYTGSSVGYTISQIAGSAFAADKVNINTADAATLDEVLVNVGPSKAKAIVDYREANGAFRSAEQLAMVKGIGLSTIEKNRDRIVVGGAGKSKKAKATAK